MVAAPSEVPGLYALADVEALAPTSVSEAAGQLARAGVGWIQLRAKRLPDDELIEQAVRVAAAIAGSGSRLWINDRPDVAVLVESFGLHLGQDDVAPGQARRIVGPDMAIGLSTHSRTQIVAADADPEVDVIAIGPVFATSSKERTEPVVGLELLRWARRRTAKPLVAIGGIDAANAAAVLAAGADCVAVLGAVCHGDPAANARALLAAVAAAGGGRPR